MHFESLGGGDDDGEFGLESALATFDVEELFCTKISTKASLCHYIISIRHRHTCGNEGVASMCDIGERTSMHEGWSLLCSLYEIGLDSIHQQDGDGTTHTHIANTEGGIVHLDAQDDVVDASAQIIKVFGKTKNRHDFRSWRDVEACLSRDAVSFRAQSCHNSAQVTVIHVKHTFPQNLLEGKAIVQMLVEVVIQQGSNHVVGCGHGMEVACEVEIDFLHRQHLCITSACCTTFHAKARA